MIALYPSQYQIGDECFSKTNGFGQVVDFWLWEKFVKWQGSENKYWTPVIKRGMVKGIVDLTSRGKKLSKASLDVIKSTTFETTFEEENLK